MALSFMLPFSLKRLDIFQAKALFPAINLIDFTNQKTNEIAGNSHFVQNV